MNKRVKFLTHSAIIAALYVILTMLARLMGLDSGVIQVRFSESLCVLCVFTPAAIPGLTVGCLISNFLVGGALWDIVFGSMATLIGAVGGYMLRKNRWLVPLPTVISNALIIPPVLMTVYGAKESFWFLFATVGIGEIISAYILGTLLYSALKRTKIKFI